MATKIRKCRSPHCLHDGVIDIEKDEFVKIKTAFYHKDCREEIDSHVRCKYSNCKHDSRVMDIRKEEYIFDGVYYWHPDCKHESDTIREIIDYWYRHVDDDESNFGNLQRVIRNLIDNKGYEPEYILFALKEKAQYLNHPPGLYYATDDYRLKEKWKQEKIAKIPKPKVDVKPVLKEAKIYNLSDSTAKNINNFADIFGGM